MIKPCGVGRGSAGPRLADELEALGRAFEREAVEIEIVEASRRERRNLTELFPRSSQMDAVKSDPLNVVSGRSKSARLLTRVQSYLLYPGAGGKHPGAQSLPRDPI